MMLTKTQPDEIQNYLSDASYLKGGNASRVVFPESAEEVAEVLAEASNTKTPVTVSGAGTGTVAGRVPFGGIVVAAVKAAGQALVDPDQPLVRSGGDQGANVPRYASRPTVRNASITTTTAIGRRRKLFSPVPE